MSRSSKLTQPDISCPTVSGVASIKCVLPIFTTCSKLRAFASIALRSRFTAGISFSATCVAAAMCIAVGNVSFDDCDMLTSSFGCIGFFDPISPPAISIARLEITSLAFMFVCVPLPVCQMCNGKCSSSFPAITSSAACTINRAFSAESFPMSSFTRAAAFFRMPKPRITDGGIVSRPISKCISDRAVCAP